MTLRSSGRTKFPVWRRSRADGNGVLVESEIKRAIANGELVKGGDPNQVRGCSYDLTVGTIFWQEKILSGPDAHVIIPPGGVVAIMTREEVELPDDMFATAFAINKMSSRGFLVVNPGHVDPGFKGALTVKALNIRKVPMPLAAGANIFTVIFQRLPKRAPPYPALPSSRVRDFNETIVETAPRTIFEMMVPDRDGPYPSREEVNTMLRDLERQGPFPNREQVKEMIRENRLVVWTFFASIATLLAALAGLLLSGIAAYKSIHPSPADTILPPVSADREMQSNGGGVPPNEPFQTSPLPTPTPAAPPAAANRATPPNANK